MPKKILIFSLAYLPFIGGAELAVKEITERLGDFQFDLITLRFDRRLPKAEKIGNVNVYRLGFAKDEPAMADLVKFPLALNKLFFPFSAFFKAMSLQKKNHYDATWSIMANYAGFAALFFKIFHPRVPFLLTLQEGDPLDYIKKKTRFVYPLFKMIFKRADFIQAISNYLARFAREMGGQGEIEVAPNAVDIKHFSQGYPLEELLELKRKLNKQPGDKFIITTSRLVKKNAVDDVIKALKYLPADFKFFVLGSGPDEKNLKNLTKDLKLEERVKFLGQIDQREISKYLKISEVFIRPSLSEGLGNSFLEAMAAGLPVIATRVGGIPDFLFAPEESEAPTGLFCRVRDPESIAEKVKILFQEEELRKKIIVNGEKLTASRYDWKIIATQMENIFNRIWQKRKVLLATGIFSPEIGGPATYTSTLLKELPKYGFAVKVVTYGNNKAKNPPNPLYQGGLIRNRIPQPSYNECGAGSLSRGLNEENVFRIDHEQNIILRYLKYFWRVWRLAKWAEVIYVQGPVSEGLPSWLACRWRRRKYVLKIVGDYAWEQASQRRGVSDSLDDFQNKKYDWRTELWRQAERKVARDAEIIITPSEYLKSIVAGWGIKEEKIKVIYNFMPEIKTTLSQAEAKAGLNLSGKIIFSAGRLVPWKGFAALIEIMPDLLKVNPDLELLIAGDGPEKKKLEKMISDLSLEKNVRLLGQVEKEKLWQYLRAAEMFVLNTGYEGLSHVIIEALALGAPVITTRVGGNPELILDNETGLLVKYNDCEDLKQSILALEENPEKREQLTFKAKESLGKFSQEMMFKELIKILRQAV